MEEKTLPQAIVQDGKKYFLEVSSKTQGCRLTKDPKDQARADRAMTLYSFTVAMAPAKKPAEPAWKTVVFGIDGSNWDAQKDRALFPSFKLHDGKLCLETRVNGETKTIVIDAATGAVAK